MAINANVKANPTLAAGPGKGSDVVSKRPANGPTGSNMSGHGNRQGSGTANNRGDNPKS